VAANERASRNRDSRGPDVAYHARAPFEPNAICTRDVSFDRSANDHAARDEVGRHEALLLDRHLAFDRNVTLHPPMDG
jgi:hypothetical protein